MARISYSIPIFVITTVLCVSHCFHTAYHTAFILTIKVHNTLVNKGCVYRAVSTGFETPVYQFECPY